MSLSIGDASLPIRLPLRFHLGFIAVTGIALFLAYSNSFGPGADRPASVNWTLDNKYIIESDDRTKTPAKLFAPATWRRADGGASFVDIWTKDYWFPKGVSGLYRPVVTFSYWINWTKLSRDETNFASITDPVLQRRAADDVMRQRLAMFHLVNLLAHWLAAVLVYFVALLLLDRFWTSAAMGLLFALHPVATESVTNIIGRADIFAAIAVLSGLLFYIRAIRAQGLRKLPWLVGLGLVSTLGVFSKESAIAVVGAAVCYDAIYRVPWREMFRRETTLIRENALLALQVVFVTALAITWTLATLKGVVPRVNEWLDTPRQNPQTPAAMTLLASLGFMAMLAICAASFISLLLASAIVPWAKQRLPVLIGALALPTVYCAVLAIADWSVLWSIGFTLIAGAIVMQAWLARDHERVETVTESTNVWSWLSAHYFVFIPMLVVLPLVRSAVFDATTPPETPFLDNPIRGVNWLAGLLTATHVLAKLWGLLAWPMNLSCDYAFNDLPTFGNWSSALNDTASVLSAILVLAVIAGIIISWRRGMRAAPFFAAFFFVTFLPTSNFIVTIGAIMAERFVYLPMVGFVACIVLGVEWLARRAPRRIDPNVRAWVSTGIFACIAIGYGFRTYHRNLDWRSDYTLWASARSVVPDSFRAHQSYAFALYEELRKPTDQRQPETRNVTADDCIHAIAKGRPIVDQLPDRYNSSRLYMHEGMYKAFKAELGAEQLPNNLVRLPAESVQLYLSAIESLELARRMDRAFNLTNRQKELMRGKALEEIPDAGLPMVYEFLGDANFRLGRADEAIENYRYMRRLAPKNADAYEKLANILSQQGRTEAAAVALIQALWIDPARTYLWNGLSQLLESINPEAQPAVINTTQGPRMDTSRAVVQTTLMLAYQQHCRIFLESKAWADAATVREVAVNEMKLPQGLFDSLFAEYGRTPPPIKPKPLRADATR